MFSVIISEKGGAERRETFDRTEINVGRVQGNDLMLPKGNVSKRHARLLFRDGRFIVTDLKSTNGTYVNGRKIAQATIVREGDKIYIGDFVLRIEAGQGSPSQASASQPAPPLDDLPSDLQSAPPGPIDESVPPPARPAFAAKPPPAPSSAGISVALSSGIPAPPPIPKHIAAPLQPISMAETPKPVLVSAAVVPEPSRAPAPASEAPWLQAGPEAVRAPAPSVPAPISPDGPVIRQSGPPGEPPSSSQPSSAAEKALRPPAPRIEPKTGDLPAAGPGALRDRHEIISHFPLEHDPDESMHFAVPGPPRVPSSPRPLNKTAPSAQPAAPMGDPGRVPQPAPGATGVPQPAPIRGAAIQPTAPGTPFNLPAPPLVPAPAPGASLAAGQAGAHASLDRATSPSVGLAALGIVPLAGPLAVSPEGSRPPPARRPALEGSQRPRSAAPTDGGLPREGDPVTGGSTAPTPGAALQRAALADLVHRVEELADLSALAEGARPDETLTARIERALADASAPFHERSDVDVEALLAEARREICELGPLTQLFDDEDVGEMQVVRHDYVVALHGSRQVAAEVGFSSEAAVGRAIRRLCLAAGKPLAEGETFVERRLPRGARLFAVLPREEDHGHMVVVRKPQRADLSLEDLVRSGTISRAMASLLSQCVAAHANILVAGAAGAGTTTLLGALAGAGSTEDRVVVLQEDDELVFNQPHTVSILLGDKPEERVRAIQAAARIRPDRLVVGAFAGAAAAEMVDAMGNGADGVLAGARAPTLRQAVHRLTADIAATRPGLSPEVAREWLASVFDLAIEVARLRDGRHRVLRVAELAVEGNRIALRDVFTFAVERTAAGGTLEGTFSATGVVPSVLDDVAARGIPVDTSIFRRHARADAGEGGAQSPRLGSADATPLPRTPTR